MGGGVRTGAVVTNGPTKFGVLVPPHSPVHPTGGELTSVTSAAVRPKLGVPQISTGELFRENITGGTKLGLEAQKYLDAGDLVPSTLTNALVDDRLDHDDVAGGFILDGFPRTVEQAEALHDMLERRGLKLDAVVRTADTASRAATASGELASVRMTGVMFSAGCRSMSSSSSIDRTRLRVGPARAAKIRSSRSGGVGGVMAGLSAEGDGQPGG